MNARNEAVYELKGGATEPIEVVSELKEEVNAPNEVVSTSDKAVFTSYSY
ncbi:hypothetical protein ACFPN4_13300 [Ureibacillus thermophilus]